MLDGQRILVAGGAGEVGAGIVRQLLAVGAQVIVPSRSEQRLTELRSLLDPNTHARLHTWVADLGTLEGALAFRAQLERELGQPQHVVASLGGWWQGQPLVDVRLDLWQRLLDNSLTAHFITAKVFLPPLADTAGSSYTLINGGGALNPVPTAGPISISAAGQLMLQRVLAAEHHHQPVRINALVLATPVITRSRPDGPASWLSADDAGRYCVYLASAAASSVRGQTIIFAKAAELPGV